MNSWWQEGIESQAIDRVNRIGQKKPVHVYQLIAEDTVESKVLAIQDKKKKFVQQVRIIPLLIYEISVSYRHFMVLREAKPNARHEKQDFKVRLWPLSA